MMGYAFGPFQVFRSGFKIKKGLAPFLETLFKSPIESVNNLVVVRLFYSITQAVCNLLAF